jgi:hypothetical protein
MSPREFDRLSMADVQLLWSQIEREQQATNDAIAGMRR